MITTLTLRGMTCQHCVRAVFTALAAVPGIHRADVSIGSAAIEHDGSVTIDQLREAIAVVGYEVEEPSMAGRRSLPII